MTTASTYRVLAVTLIVMTALTAATVAEAWQRGVPTWRGATAEGASLETGYTLIDDPAQAKKVWQSEDLIPPAYTQNNVKQQQSRSGFASPIIGDGKVFVYYFRPSGEAQDEERRAARIAADDKRREQGKKPAELEATRYSIDADDVVQAWDAKTGEHVWTFEAKGKAINTGLFACHHSPTYADGVLYVFGLAGKVYAVKTADGSLLWESDIGTAHREIEADRIKAHAEKRFVDVANKDKRALWMAVPNVVDGVPIFPDYRGGLIAFDTDTGAVKWTLANSLYGYNTALPWVHAGKTHAISINASPWHERNDNYVNCFDPQTGRLLWSFNAGDIKGSMPAISGDVLVARIGDKNSNEIETLSGLGAWRLTLTGPEQLWEHRGPEFTIGSSHSPTIYRGIAYGTAHKDGSKKFRGEAKHDGVFAIELETGKLIGHSNNDIKTYSLMQAGGGKLLVASKMSVPNLVEPASDGQPPKWLGEIAVPDHSHGGDNAGCTTPVLVNGFMYIRRMGGIICFDLRQ